MAKLKIEINLDNAVFAGEYFEAGYELARILRMLAEDAETQGLFGPLRGYDVRGIYDSNGNRIGTVEG